MQIIPTEKRDQHCKIYVEKSLKNEIERYAQTHHYSFSEAGRKLLIHSLERFQEGKFE